MPITSAELILFGSANRPEDDATASGGAIATTVRPVFTDFTGNQTIRVSSDGADTRTVTIDGRNTAGANVTEVLTLNGTTPVNGTQVFERISSVDLSATDAARTVTVQTNEATPQTIGTIPPNELGFYRMFRNSASDPAAAKVRYEKVFWKNTNASLTLNQAQVTLTADPAAKIRMGVATTKNDTTSVANRLTAPTGITFVDDNVAQAVPGNTLEAGSAIGVWIEQTLAAGDAAQKTTFTLKLDGTTV